MNKINKEELGYIDGLIQGYIDVAMLMRDFRDSDVIERYLGEEDIKMVLNMFIFNINEKVSTIKAERDNIWKILKK